MSGQRPKAEARVTTQPEARPTPEPGSGDALGSESLGEGGAVQAVSPPASPPNESAAAADTSAADASAGTSDAVDDSSGTGGSKSGETSRTATTGSDTETPTATEPARPSFDGFEVAPAGGEASSYLPEAGTGPDARIVAIVVTHKRRELLAESLKVLTSQTRPVDHLIVVDNANEAEVADLVEQQPIETTYLGSAHNLGGAGGFALGMLHALTLGADWVWLADDDGRPDGPEVLATLLDCAGRHGLVEVSPVVCDIDEPDRLAFPLRRGVVWRRLRSELGDDDFLPGIASLFNGALISAKAVDVIGVPDLRLFVRGDEVEVHRRLVRSGLPFGTCLQTAYLHPNGAAEFKPILGGRMHTQYPDDPVKRYFTYRNRGYLMSQPGMRKLLPQEWIRFSWFFLVTRRDPAGLREWFHLRSLGRNEHFGKPD